MRMTLQDYIDKYGEESGTKRYYGMQKLLASRKKTYDSQPYARFTKEWFLWKYPNDGLDRFNRHVEKSRQSEENMIKRWGEEVGKKKWAETVAKKNTLQLIKDRHGEDAVTAINDKRKKSIKEYWDSLSPEEKELKLKKRGKKISRTKKIKYKNKTKLELFIEKYGEDGHVKYAEYLQTIFKSIGHSKEAETLIKSIIDSNKWLLKYSLYYRDSSDKSKAEWFLSTRDGVYFYDFCVREAKAILEYDGAKWHPTEEQAIELNDQLMEISRISYIQKYKNDQAKLKMAVDLGFTVFVIRSDFTAAEKTNIINKFINFIKDQDK